MLSARVHDEVKTAGKYKNEGCDEVLVGREFEKEIFAGRIHNKEFVVKV